MIKSYMAFSLDVYAKPPPWLNHGPYVLVHVIWPLRILRGFWQVSVFNVATHLVVNLVLHWQ